MYKIKYYFKHLSPTLAKTESRTESTRVEFSQHGRKADPN